MFIKKRFSVARIFKEEEVSNSDRISVTHDDLEGVVFEPQDYVVIDLDNLIDLSFLGNSENGRIELEVIRLTNVEREKTGLVTLLYNEYLSRSALLHTIDMAECRFISHTGSDGSDLRKRVDQIGYRDYSMIGENLAMGFADPEKVVQGWMNSPGHRENILKSEFNEIGVAYIEAHVPTQDGKSYRKGGYWTQHFGYRPRRQRGSL